jgi:hypothetical protein
MDYRTHTKQRFKEKFVPINLQPNRRKRKFWRDKCNKQWLELTDDDYDNLCNICRNEPLLIQGERSRVLVQYNQMYMWCIMTKKKKVVKTIYPINKGDYNKFLKKLVS